MNVLIDQIADALKAKVIGEKDPALEKIVAKLAPQSSEAKGKTYSTQTQETAQNLTGIASKIDHTLLKSDATHEEIRTLCNEAQEHGFATVCVNSSFISLAASLLEGSQTKAITVVGFPLGAMSSTAKAFEAREAVLAGAQEIDMVIHLGALKCGDYAKVFEDIQLVVQAARPYPVKVILETTVLNEEQKKIACVLSKAAGAGFVKTSTGFGGGGATVEDILLMRKMVGPEMGVKASGGIRTYEDALKMISAGATRIGTSAGIALVQAEKGQPSLVSPKATTAY